MKGLERARELLAADLDARGYSAAEIGRTLGIGHQAVTDALWKAEFRRRASEARPVRLTGPRATTVR